MRTLKELTVIAAKHSKEIMSETNTIAEAMVVDMIIHDIIYTIKTGITQELDFLKIIKK